MGTGEPYVRFQGDEIRRNPWAGLDGEAPEASTYLPFNMPNRATLFAASRKVFAHYFTQFPVSIDNKNPDTDATEYMRALWLPPGEVEGATDHRVYGGFIRDRYDSPDGVTRPRSGDFRYLDSIDEVRACRAAGFDGFTVDLLDVSTGVNQHWSNFVKLLRAAEYTAPDDFLIVPMPDGGAGMPGNPSQMNADLLSVAASTSLWRIGGDIVVAPYNPEGAGATGADVLNFWTAHKAAMAAGGRPIKLWNCYTAAWNSAPAKTAPTLDAISYGHGRWGNRDYAAAAGDTSGDDCHATYSKPWMHYASPGDSRPRSSTFWEAYGTTAWRNAWASARDSDAEMVQVPTWNDLSECTNIMPSVNSGYAWLDLSAYYITWYKLGVAPTIVRDGIYLSHRIHHSTVNSVSSTQTSFQTAAQSAAMDKVEALCFLTAPADIEITVCGVTTTHNAVAAGVNAVYADLPDATSGAVSVVAKRSSVAVPGTAVTSPHAVQATPVSQDMQYRICSSLRP